MYKSKWIIGLSIAGVMALSGTAFALNSGSVPGVAPTVATTQNQSTVTDTTGAGTVNSSSSSASQSTLRNSQSVTPQPVTTTSSFQNNEANATSPGTYGNGGYGMMGGYGANGAGGGYGMMGGYGANGTGGGYGMMGGYGANGTGGGYGMMGGYGANGTGGGYGMMGGGYGMMGGGYNAQSLGVSLTNGEVATSDQAIAIVNAYTQKLNQDVVVDELHEFSNAYEVELKDGKTGDKAYEVIVYKNGGLITTEMGPNIMWNTKYGHMNWGNTGAVTVSEEQATNYAQEFVTKLGQGYSIGKPDLAPGYYEFMVQKDGKDYAELDVNGYTGQVWFENWNGPILNTTDVK